MNTFLPSLAATSQNPNSAVLHIKHGGRLFREGECHKERKGKKKENVEQNHANGELYYASTRLYAVL